MEECVTRSVFAICILWVGSVACSRCRSFFGVVRVWLEPCHEVEMRTVVRKEWDNLVVLWNNRDGTTDPSNNFQNISNKSAWVDRIYLHRADVNVWKATRLWEALCKPWCWQARVSKVWELRCSCLTYSLYFKSRRGVNATSILFGREVVLNF